MKQGERSEPWWVRNSDGDLMIAMLRYEKDVPVELTFCGSDMEHYLDGRWGDDPTEYQLVEPIPLPNAPGKVIA